MPRNGAGGLTDGKLWVSTYAIKLEWIYHADSHNLSCVKILYTCTFDVNNQLAN